MEICNPREVKVNVYPDIDSSGILYIGQYGTSGYGTAVKGNLIYFFTRNVPIKWKPIYLDNSVLNDDCYYNTIVKSLIDVNLTKFDTIFLHSTPDLWPEIKRNIYSISVGRKVIGYTTWETDQLPRKWVGYINDSVDEVWCPSTYNKEVFKNSGVKVPIVVFPHVFLKKTPPPKENVNISSELYTFYTIGEFNSRKGIDDLIRVFCETFTNDDRVRLVLKVHYKDYSEDNKEYCRTKINNITSEYSNAPVIEYILDNITDSEISGLHAAGDCYVSLTKSEGFGLTLYDAYKYGKKIIVTGYGGHVDFLGKNYQGFVKYTLENILSEDEMYPYYTKEQKWAYPDLTHVKTLLKESYQQNYNQ